MPFPIVFFFTIFFSIKVYMGSNIFNFNINRFKFRFYHVSKLILFVLLVHL